MIKMALIDIDFPELIKGLGDFYSLIAATTIGSIVALVIQDDYNKLDKKSKKEWIKFILHTLKISMIVTIIVIPIVWLMSKVIGGISI